MGQVNDEPGVEPDSRQGKLNPKRKHFSAELLMGPQGGHFPCMERPADVAKDIEDFVAEVWPT
jgi:pimeloyl-ACP methyl ester carboxylesterase